MRGNSFRRSDIRARPGHKSGPPVNKDFLRAVSWRTVANASSLLNGVLTLWVVKRHLLPAAYGVVVVGLQLLQYLPMFDGGFRMVINRRLLAEKDPEVRERWLAFSRCFYTYFSLAVLLAGALAVWAYSLAPNAAQAGESHWFFVVLGATGALQVIGYAQASLLTGLGLQHQLYRSFALGAWTNLGVLVLAMESGMGMWSFPLALSSTGICVWGTSARQMRTVAPSMAWLQLRATAAFTQVFRGSYREAVSCLGSQIAMVLIMSLDVVLVGLLGVAGAMVGVFGVVARLLGVARSFLQAGSEAFWPILARGESESRAMALTVVQANAWLFGAVGGTLPFVMGPFLEWLMGVEWRPPAALVCLMTARFLILGLFSPAAYFLVARGQYHTLARLLAREIIAGAVLSTLVAPRWGATGVAGAFLAAAGLGTFAPILLRAARVLELPAWRLLGAAWLRAGLAVILSGGVSAWLIAGRGGVFAVPAGLAGASVAVGFAGAWAVFRARMREGPLAASWRERLVCAARHL